MFVYSPAGIYLPKTTLPDGRSFSFSAGGDIGYGGDMTWLQDNHGDFFLVPGDLGYTSDAQDWCQNYISQASTNVVWVSGNHETDDSGPGRLLGSGGYVANCPPPAGFAFVGSWGIRYYFDYPTLAPIARFIGITSAVASSELDGDYSAGSANYGWVSATIDDAKNRGLWTIVFMHKNCITTGSKSCSEDQGNEDIWTLLLNKQIDLVIQGHDHNYQRTHQLNCAPPFTFRSSCVVDSDSVFNRGSGTVLVIDGSFGHCCYSVSSGDAEAGYFALADYSGNVGSKFTVTTETITQQAQGTNGFSFSDSFTISGQTQILPAASFAWTPLQPVEGETVSFAGAATGGTPPYNFSWNLGDGATATGPTVTHAFAIRGDYSVVLSVSDSAGNRALAAGLVTVDAVPPPPVPKPAPTIVGWGGIRLEEAVTYLPTNPPSDIFPEEQASNQEMQSRKLSAMGYNGFRVSFQSPCNSWQEMGPYNPAWLHRSIAIASYYGLWLIVDYHGYSDLADAAGSDCWLSFWSQVVLDFKDSYERLVWEPINEPTGFGDDVAYLSRQYQRWIEQTRLLGDTHWIVVQNLCSYSCGFDNMADGFPAVADSEARVFISLHTYMGYAQHFSQWNNATAEAVALEYFAAVLEGSARTGWPVLNTEGGADELCDNCAPDEALTGSAGYTTTTLHFVQALTMIYDNNLPERVNWIWWTMGSWTNTPGAGLYGSLASDGWGSMLDYEKVATTGMVGDINRDCKVDIADVLLAATSFGKDSSDTGYYLPADINGDNTVDVVDIAIVGGNYGSTCP